MLRSIKQEELVFVRELIALSEEKFDIPNQIIELEDGGMGSIQFSDTIVSSFINVVEVEYMDIDNVLVLISLRAADGKLTELDFWKTDFSILQKYPTIDEVKLLKL